MFDWIKRFWKRNGNTTTKVAGFVIAERAITVVGRVVVDAPMIYLFKEGYGILDVITMITPVHFVFTLAVVALYDFFLKKGRDLLGIEYLRGLETAKLTKKQLWKKFGRWIIRRRLTIFWIGTIVYLDSDVVTLLLRKKEDTIKNILKITLPSVIWSMIFWSVIYKLGVMGVKYFVWFVE